LTAALTGRPALAIIRARTFREGLMFRFLPAAAGLVAAALLATPAAADEFTDTIEGALEAYRDGDVNAARQDLDYAAKLLAAMKSDSLAKFLPPAMAGWTRTDGDADESGAMMGMFGGGTMAGASYAKDDGTELTIDLVADSPMVSGMAAMVGSLSAMGGGKPMRIQRVEFAEDDEGIRGVVNGKVLVTVSGDATLEEKRAYLEAMDLGALGEF
jgi:hypothetical protein